MGLFQAEVMGTACQAWSSYPGLSRGAIRTLITHASDEVKDIFVRRMVSGEWTGTMCLTEPQCGSDLNQVSKRRVLSLLHCCVTRGFENTGVNSSRKK